MLRSYANTQVRWHIGTITHYFLLFKNNFAIYLFDVIGYDKIYPP